MLKDTMKIFTQLMVGVMMCVGLNATVLASSDPVKVIEQSTKETIAIIQASKATFKNNPSAYYQKLDRQLSKLINVDSFVRKVMGSHANTAGMDAAKKKATNQRVDRFKRKFKTQLFSTYGTMLLGYSGQKYKVLPLSSANKAEASAGKPVVVSQVFYVKSKQYKVDYKMIRSGSTWKVSNIRIVGADVTKALRNQFNQAMKKHNNNVDRVIDTWKIGSQK
ncbi:MAG: ABC transporter substrate-binding protein [Pseudomonadota bacterium]